AVRRELLALRGGVQTMTHLYRVPGRDGPDRLYLLRHGLVRGEFDWPQTPDDAARVAELVQEELSRVEPGPLRVTPHQAAEILLVARWFRLNPEERDRLLDPAEFLEARLSA